MRLSLLSLPALLVLSMAPSYADTSSSPLPAPSGGVNAGGHSYDPCAMVSQQDVASAAGVAVNQVSSPSRPTSNECAWAVASHAGAPAQQVVLTLQSADEARKAHGLARFTSALSAVQSIPGVPAVNNPIVNEAFSGAQEISDLGDRAGWKNGVLFVLKGQVLMHVDATGQSSDSQSLVVSKAIARSAIENMKT